MSKDGISLGYEGLDRVDRWVTIRCLHRLRRQSIPVRSVATRSCRREKSSNGDRHFL